MISYLDKAISIFSNRYSQRTQSTSSLHERLEDGVSIIIPSFNKEKLLLQTLDSLERQEKIDFSLLEVLIIVNGIHSESTMTQLDEYQKKHSKLYIKIYLLENANVSRARNHGIAMAKKKFTLFCDDDDLFSPLLIATLYRKAREEALLCCQIADLNKEGQLNFANAINKQLKKRQSIIKKGVKSFYSILSMNAAKLIPTKNLKQLRFHESLKSGEDVAFFTEYYLKFKPQLKYVKTKDCYYIRRLIDNSVSRQAMSYDFNIEQRLDVIKILLSLDQKTGHSNKDYVRSKVLGQCGFIINYLKKYPSHYTQLHSSVITKGIKDFPYNYIKKGLGITHANLLVISYCYPPFVDTSGIVAAKRVLEFNEFCDVLCNDMSSVRATDHNLLELNNHLIRHLKIIKTKTSWNDAREIEKFANQVMNKTRNESYSKIYSRSFWIGSHFAAYKYKSLHPEIIWIAEFSDPLFLDINGQERQSTLSDKLIKSLVLELGLDESFLQQKNLFIWCELITYLKADELIFTCENQRQFMLEKFPYEFIKNKAYEKSKIIPHPSLGAHYYQYSPMKLPLHSDVIHFGYFGTFYNSRHLNDLFTLIQLFDKNLRHQQVKTPLIHLFTNNVVDAKRMVESYQLQNYFAINPYLSYFDFLSLCNQLNVLIVEDSDVPSSFGVNPYLPSKTSDYLGSTAKIWAFCDEGSALSQIERIDFKSRLHHIEESYQTLLNIINHQ